ncbi:LacI family DNA-binding transcriptional regulator [Kribbella sp. NPDC056951]|uniref:LacI family DNA-binding transcriptional regulator n=1 Tax=Kribbella sp. NPDC056951 TaxID=3345978 RepID=UPI003624C99E
MSSPVTRNDVARYAGVSTAVVSYVVNDGPRAVSPAARERVLEAIRVLGYRPNATARALRTGSTRTFGLITPDGGNPLFAELAKAIDKAADERGYVVLQTSADGDPGTERTKVAQLLARQVSGLVLVTPTEAPDLAGADVPVVVVNRVLPGVSSVSPRYREGARAAVEHLVWHGHTRIALVIGGPGARRGGHAAGKAAPTPADEGMGFQRGGVPERERGWREGLRGAGLADGPLIRVGFSREGGYDAGRWLVGLGERPTAVFASSDLQAVGLLRAVREAGLRVPEDLAVVAFDGTPEAEWCWPGLTVVRQPVERMAAEVVRQLVEGTNGEATACPTELVVRKSCGC